MSKITPLMTSLHEGHKAEERINCIDNMLFKERRCEDTKWTVLQAFWWYRKNSIPLDRIKQAREQIIDEKDFAYADFERYKVEYLGQDWEDASDSLPQDDFRYGMERCLEILDEMIVESEKTE